MTEDVYHIAHQLVAEYGTQANAEIQRKIARYTESRNYNALKTWYAVEEAFSEIQNLTETRLVMESLQDGH